MSGSTCYACGREARDSYCGRCGASQAPADRRHWQVLHAHERAARTAVRKAKMDRDLYSVRQPLDTMVEAVAMAIADEERNREVLFGAVGGAGSDGLYTDRVVRLARERLAD